MSNSPEILSVKDIETDALATLDDEAELLDDEELSQYKYRLPFGFAKRHSVLVEDLEDGFVLHCTKSVSADILLEVRRFLGSSYSITEHSPDDFEQLLTQAYQRGSSEAKQMMEDIGN